MRAVPDRESEDLTSTIVEHPGTNSAGGAANAVDAAPASAMKLRASLRRSWQVSVLLVEEIVVLRDLFTRLINDQPDTHVASAVHEPRAVLARARELQPTVILFGISHRERTRLRLIRLLRRVTPGSSIIAMIFRPTEERLSAYTKAGVDGFILDDTSISSLLYQIRVTANLRPGFAAPLAEPAVSPAPRTHDLGTLTTREKEVTRLIRDGRCNKDIARELDLSLHTVKAHVRSILEKLAVHSRLEIAARAYDGAPAAD
jgi:DNA-binding NarL/FixJ family response regulator